MTATSPDIARANALEAKLTKALLRATVDLPRSHAVVPPTSRDLLASGAVSIKGDDGNWIRFDPWPAQLDALDSLEARLVVWLKARQLGMTWLALAHALWMLLAKPGATVLLFSRRDTEAIELLDRLEGMHRRLPDTLRQRVEVDNGHNLTLGNGSRALAFPCTAGDSYTARLVVIDEAALVPDLGRLMGAVKPTIDAGGQLLLLSRANKSDSEGLFARTFRAAEAGENPSWRPLFLPWSARPDRTPEWYAEQKQDIESREGSPDTLWEQYPETAAQALAERQLDKRFPLAWIEQCTDAVPGTRGSIPGTTVYTPPQSERRYVIGGDAAEGNPTSDDSAAQVLDLDTGIQVAKLQGKHEPGVFADGIAKLSQMYNGAPCLPERNNHGHAVILALKSHEIRVRILNGHDGKPGWLSSGKGKVLLYDDCAEALREKQVTIRDRMTAHQLGRIEGGTLRAPEGQHDDLADSFALAVVAMEKAASGTGRTGIFGR